MINADFIKENLAENFGHRIHPRFYVLPAQPPGDWKPRHQKGYPKRLPSETSFHVEVEQIQPFFGRDLTLTVKRHTHQAAQDRTQAKTARNLVMERG